eukprot:TRINITY_DN1831_c0_g1_i1.p1 TRINITY_DN1831_c0_g1~~TRINITY_DN1831_c0_g1_i1.p1  ORF type:complete len:474 (-),score=37.18 TRINITY_DN1831_c0_g1_i1:130-1551(-)
MSSSFVPSSARVSSGVGGDEQQLVRRSSLLMRSSLMGSGAVRSGIRSFVAVRPSLVENEVAIELDAGHGMNWVEASLLVVAEVLGIGILAVPGGFRKLGWLMAFVFLFACYPLNLYTSLLLVRVRRLSPESVTLSDIAEATLGTFAGIAVRFMLLAYLQCLLGDFVLVLGKQIVSMLASFDFDISLQLSMALTIVILLPTNQLRTLQNCTFLCIASFISILIALIICLVYMFSHGCADMDGGASDDLGSPWSSFVALSSFSLACAGQSVYLEMMSEMRDPDKFAWSLHAVIPGLILIYGLTGTATYGMCGDSTPQMMTDVVPDKTWMKGVVALLVFLHTVVSYTINQQVLARSLHALISPDRARVQKRSEDGYWTARLQWFAITISQQLVALGFAMGANDFDRIVTLVSALFVGPLSFLLPIGCLLGVPRNLLDSVFRRTKTEELIAWSLLALMTAYTVLTIITAIIPFTKAE